jgi:hypothetical protein
VLTEHGGRVLTLDIRGANGWSFVAQGSRSLDRAPIPSKTPAARAA